MALQVQQACSSILSAMGDFTSYIFYSGGTYTRNETFESASQAIATGLDEIGLNCEELNTVQNASDFTYLQDVMSSMGGMFDSMASYSADIEERDVSGLVLGAASQFVGDAWSMLVTINETVTNCELLMSQEDAAIYLQNGFLAVGQINTSQETFYQTIHFPSCSASPSASASVDTAPSTVYVSSSQSSSSSSKHQGPTTAPNNPSTSSALLVTTFPIETSTFTNRAGLLGGCLIGSLALALLI